MSQNNGCWNGKRPTPDSWYWAQDGYHETLMPDGRIERGAPKWIRVKVFSDFLGCMYDASARDRRCDGCAHAPHLRSPA